MIITIPGNPIPQQRARVSRNRFYDPLCIVKKQLQPIVQSQITIDKLLKVPLDVDISFHMPFPKNTSKSIKNTISYLPHSKRPDLDNMLKFYLDLLNGLVYFDDSLISKLTCKKIYDFDPKTVIIIKKLEL